MAFADKLRELRIKKNMTQGELSRALNISQSAIAMYESGKREPKIEILEIFADYFNVDMNYITDKTNRTTILPNSPEYSLNKPVMLMNYKIPVLGKVAAGTPIEACEDIIDYIFIEEKHKDDGHEYFALQIQGHSMEPTIMDGDIVVVRKQTSIQDGEIAIVLVDSEDATAKEVKESSNGITLIGHNAAVYTPHFYSREDIENLPVQVLGKVIKVIREF